MIITEAFIKDCEFTIGKLEKLKHICKLFVKYPINGQALPGG
jgi:hypothetical protein